MPETYTPLLLRKKERDFFLLCREFSDEVLNQYELLDRQCRAYIKGDYQDATGMHGLIINAGKSIRGSRAHLLIWVSENQVNPENKSHLLDLVFKISNISNHIEASSYRIQLKEYDLGDEVVGGIKQIAVLNMKAVQGMHECVRLMNEDLETAIDLCHELADVEDSVDDIRRGLLKSVVNDEAYSDAQVLFSITQILSALETITDKVEDVGNLIEIIAIKHLP